MLPSDEVSTAAGVAGVAAAAVATGVAAAAEGGGGLPVRAKSIGLDRWWGIIV